MIDQTGKFTRGSEWRKWDLHIHSPLSGLNNQYPKNPDGSPDWEQFISKLEEMEDVSVVGITDYFFIDGYKEVVEFKRQGRLGNFDLALPNVELRLDNFVVRDKSKDINFHVVFSNELEIDDVEKEFIEALDVQTSGSVNGISGVRKLNRRSLLEIGKEIKENHALFRDDSDEEAAFKNITVSLKQVQELLRKDLFRGKFLFILSGHEWADIDWNQAYLTKKNFLQTAQVLETGSLDTIHWALGKKDISREDFIKEFGALKPSIYGSDAHCLAKICKPEANKFCWIKADPTFDGLKQIIYEPEDRVYIGNSPPKGKNDANVVDRIEIKNSNSWFAEKPILLNDNLVAVIGEKGAGKTALADLIALAGGDYGAKEEDPGSFIFKALKPTKQIEQTIENCIITIYWRDGSEDPFTVTDDFRYYRDSKKVRYLSQRFVEEKCRPERAEELQKEIENIVFQHIPAQDRMGQTTFSDLKKLRTQSVEVRKLSYKKAISNLNREVFDLEEEINALDIKKEERGKLETEIGELEEQKPKPVTEEEKNIEGKLTLLNSRKNQLNEQVGVCKAQLSTIDTIGAKVAALREYVDEQLADIKNSLESVGLGNMYEKLQFSISPDFDAELENKKREIRTQIKNLQGFEQADGKADEKNTGEHSFQKLEQIDLDSLTNDYVSGLSLGAVNTLISILESRSSIAEAKRKIIKSFDEKIEKNQKRIDELEKNIKNIVEVKKPLLPKRMEQRKEAYENYFALLQEEKKMLEEMYYPLREKLNKENLGEENQIEFFARIELDVEKFSSKAGKVIDFSRKGRYYQKKDLLFKEIKLISEKIELGEELDIYDLIIKLHGTFEGTEGVDITEQLLTGKKRIDFYNWIFDVSHFKVTYSTKYQDTNIELLSPGKKGIVLLLMYLALDTESGIPLIIDQPEENLDNKSVYAHLVDYFKIAKKRRQIIVITHNPNLVLNTDAEQIIVANFEAVPRVYESRITYISGAIENSYINETLEPPLLRQGIREHGADVLEGGKEAFVRRKDRYEY